MCLKITEMYPKRIKLGALVCNKMAFFFLIKPCFFMEIKETIKKKNNSGQLEV